MNDNEERMTKRQAAQYLGCSIKTIERHIAQGRLEKLTDRRKTYVALSQLIELKRQEHVPIVAHHSDTLSETKEILVEVGRAHYEGLLVRMGQLQAELESLRRQVKLLTEPPPPAVKTHWWQFWKRREQNKEQKQK